MALNLGQPLQLQSTELKTLDLIEEHAQEVLDNFDQFLEMTKAVTPLRQPRRGRPDLYMLTTDRTKTMHSTSEERRLERAIWKQFGDENQPRVTKDCRWVQAYQVPLKNSDEDKGWGKLDLIGVSEEYTPVVLELKRGKGDNPLRMLIEGLTYALAVQKAWNSDNGHLRKEWRSRVPEVSKKIAEDHVLKEIPIIGIAPVEYWQRAVNGEAGLVPETVWPLLAQIISKCRDAGFPVTFATFEIGLPLILGAGKIETDGCGRPKL